MSDKTKVKLAFAEAITQILWVKGFVSAKERDQINQQSEAAILCGKC